MSPEYELLQAEMTIAAKLKIIAVPRHVKSYQDKEVDNLLLPLEAKLNCDIDRLAGTVRTLLCKQPVHSQTTP